MALQIPGTRPDAVARPPQSEGAATGRGGPAGATTRPRLRRPRGFSGSAVGWVVAVVTWTPVRWIASVWIFVQLIIGIYQFSARDRWHGLLVFAIEFAVFVGLMAFVELYKPTD